MLCLFCHNKKDKNKTDADQEDFLEEVVCELYCEEYG